MTLVLISLIPPRRFTRGLDVDHHAAGFLDAVTNSVSSPAVSTASARGLVAAVHLDLRLLPDALAVDAYRGGPALPQNLAQPPSDGPQHPHHESQCTSDYAVATGSRARRRSPRRRRAHGPGRRSPRRIPQQRGRTLAEGGGRPRARPGARTLDRVSRLPATASGRRRQTDSGLADGLAWRRRASSRPGVWCCGGLAVGVLGGAVSQLPRFVRAPGVAARA